MNWEQLRAILWVRWRLSRNQFTRAGQLNAVLSVFILVVLILVGGALGIGGILLGAFVLPKVSPQISLVIWDGIIFGFLIFWVSGLMVEIQRSESIDVAKLLHLPVTLPQVFCFNYAVSHFTPALMILAPGMIGLCVGLTLGAGPMMAFLLPLVLSFIFLITAWTYCLRGWLAALMVNKRKRRAIIVWITLVLVLLGQLPNLVFNSPFFKRHKRTKQDSSHVSTSSSASRENLGLPDAFFEAHLVLPPGWVGYGAMELRKNRMLPSLAGTAASFLVGALGLMRAYRMTMRFYRGEEATSRVRQPKAVERMARGESLVGRHLPWLPDDTAALALAMFRSLTRSPELKMAAVMPVVFGVMAASVRASAPKGPLPQHLTDFAATAAILLAMFSLGPTMANAFGLDRNGFRCLVLLPTRRDQILLAKNLSFFPFVALIALVLLALMTWVAHLSWTSVATALVQLPACFVLFCIGCNFCSILVPYRLAQGTLRAKKPKAIVILAVMIFLLSMPLVMPLMLIPPALQWLFSAMGWTPWLPINFISALLVCAGMVAIYLALLPVQGRLLQRREQNILREVTEEVE